MKRPKVRCPYCSKRVALTTTGKLYTHEDPDTGKRCDRTRMTVTEYRDGRNFVRVGDLVKVAPSRPGRRNGFVSRVRRIHFDEATLQPTGVDVVDGTGAIRTVRPERITRKRQPKD